jgi:hypothetical protein
MSKTKSKGTYYENKFRDTLSNAEGILAVRQPASGAYGRYKKNLDGDIMAYFGLFSYPCFRCMYGQPDKDANSPHCPDCKDFKKFEPANLETLIKRKIEVKARKKDGFPQWITKALDQGEGIAALYLTMLPESKGFILATVEAFTSLIEEILACLKESQEQ